MTQVGAEAAQVINSVIVQLAALDVAHNQMVKGDTTDGDNRARRMLDDHVGSRGYHIASVHIASALDHLHQMASFIEHGELRAYATFSTARSALENAAQAAWLMEESLDDDNQRKRAIGAQYADYDERRKAENMMGVFPDGHVSAHQRCNDYMQLAAQFDGHTITNEETGEIRPAVNVLSHFDCCQKHATIDPENGPSGGLLYRILSAFSHGKQWSSLASQVQATTTTIPGGAVAAVHADDRLLVIAYAVPMLTVRGALTGYRHHAELD